MTHDVKITPYFFNQILDGQRDTLDLKPNWNFALGDRLTIREFDARSQSPTGRDVLREITDVTEMKETGSRGEIIKYVIVTFGKATQANGLPI